MPDSLGSPSEFGGKVQRNRTQPLPHIPTASEKLMLLYTTGDIDGQKDPEVPNVTFEGLLPEERQRKIRTEEGVFEKGQIWEQMQADAKAEADALAQEIPDE